MIQFIDVSYINVILFSIYVFSFTSIQLVQISLSTGIQQRNVNNAWIQELAIVSNYSTSIYNTPKESFWKPQSSSIIRNLQLPLRKPKQQSTLKVFILAGQSNMVGMGSLVHMELLVQPSYNQSIYRETLVCDDNQTESSRFKDKFKQKSPCYKVRSDVIMKYGDSHGFLTLGPSTGYAGSNAFGPEVMFGWTVGDYFQNQKHQKISLAKDSQMKINAYDHSTPPLQNYSPSEHPNVLLLKVAWGGRTLAIDFRPPSSGVGNYSSVPQNDTSLYGWEYRQMISDIHDSLQNIDRYVPNYNKDDKNSNFEVAGFVWFQGWNDMLNSAMVNEYEWNLANFIRDVRHDLNISNLPFVIGELGMSGIKVTGFGARRILHMRDAQRNVCNLAEFQNTTRFARTAPYAVNNGTTYNGIEHYNGRADTYYHIGQSFGKAMIELMEARDEMFVMSSSKNNLTNAIQQTIKKVHNLTQ